jgi:hypothetical protein
MTIEQTVPNQTLSRPDGPPQEEGVDQARLKAVAVLLRQLATGLSAYRLYDGDVKQPSFSAAVDRIRGAAEQILSWGALEVEILGARFQTSGTMIAQDEIIDRLAKACYERRIERLHVRAVPDSRELAVFYKALNTPLEDVAISGGVGSIMLEAGVSSLGLGQIAPQAADALIGMPPASGDDELWERLQNPAGLATELLFDEELSASLPGQAHSIFGRIQALVSMLPESEQNTPDLWKKLNEVVASLPTGLREALAQTLVNESGSTPVAENMIGTMTDAELARVLVELSANGGRRAVDIAQHLVDSGARREDLVDLVKALEAGQQEAGTIMTGLDRAELLPPDTIQSVSLSQTVSDLLAVGLLSREQEDVRALLDLFPETEEQQRTVALAAFRDYMRVEHDADRIGKVLDVWVREVQRALSRRDDREVARLLEAADAARTQSTHTDPEKLAQIEGAWRRTLTGPLMAQIMPLIEGGTGEGAHALLQPFGEAAVDGLMEMLALEDDTAQRAMLVSLIVQLSSGHAQSVASRLTDPRWYVVRNAVTILYRSNGSEVVPYLVEASLHPHPAVRREVIRGLVAVGGEEAVPALRRLAVDSDPEVRNSALEGLGGMVVGSAAPALAGIIQASTDPNERRRAIDFLGRHPSPEATSLLERIAEGNSGARMPMAFRRQAKDLLKVRRGAGW